MAAIFPFIPVTGNRRANCYRVSEKLFQRAPSRVDAARGDLIKAGMASVDSPPPSPDPSSGEPDFPPHATGVGLEHWGDQFPSTHWSLLLDDQAPENATQRLLSRICDRYWYPLYAYLRKRGRTSQDAQDLTQGFLCKMLENDGLANLARERGTFRSYLLGALKHYENDERKRERAEKRGGGKAHLSIEQTLAEERYRNEPAHDLSPEKLFDREWAMALLQDVIDQLKTEYVRQGKASVFDTLSEYLTVKPDKGTYPQIASQLGVSEGNVRVMVNRLRQRYKRLLKEVITQTVDSPDDVRDELNYLFSTFSN